MKKNKENVKIDLKRLCDQWPSAIVAREQVGTFTGGALSPRYLANLDSQGKGPKGRIRIGRKIVYPVDELVKWLEERTVVLE